MGLEAGKESTMNGDPTTATERDEWKETVCDLYDLMHFGRDSIFTGSELARKVVKMIEDRHHDYFRGSETSDV